MKLLQSLCLLPLLAAAVVTLVPCAARAADSPPTARPVLYDTTAEGKEQIAAALKTAQAENKRVILKFGANWCGWCHKLSGLLKTNAELARIVKENYLLVLIDVDKGHNADTVKKYGDPTRFGLPALVVLDTDGTPLTTQDTGLLEEGNHHDPAKVKGFLEKWRKTKPAPATP
jgi:thiol:disulfide interchange protein